jgi:hypothetical protein
MEKYYKEMQFELPIYGGDITFIHSNDIDKINEKHDIGRHFSHASTYEHNVKTDDPDVFHYKYFIVLNSKSKLGNVGIGCLCHEAFHLSNMICLNKGFIPTFENDEPQAYIIQYIFNKGLEFYFGFEQEIIK